MGKWKLSDFHYDLPDELIAQKPVEPRDSSRLMVILPDGRIEHRIFRDIVEYLNEGDCLVLNNSKVIPARLIGQREETGSFIEFLLIKRLDINTWEVMTRPGKKARKGRRFVFGNGELKAEVLHVNREEGTRVVRFYYDGVFEEVLERLGKIPLPPYIKEELDDLSRYQTVYSKVPGSAAAPTAGLHFTEELLSRISKKGVEILYVTLHVGLGTFKPVKVENVEEHKMHEEYYEISEDVTERINRAKELGKRVIAVGTTSCRVLESCCDENGKVKAKKGWTDIFIYPGYEFKVLDGLVTNFHLPDTTLMMLVCAFGGYERIMNAYKIAVDMRYRFFSFGDAMLILRR
ncbi:S-adenosylmethionine:tRNA ribosyltransferase-isomerase [Caldicellulosiruptor bescii]|uniref:S-adenosylmethionine:tRNA ribosyltransferase-isomerase n=2 Tax=Caldicellulosiruptor bescii TaxID=31899 RepID=B9MMG3_CALBD|nr:tRNA preQ1(34) S-adenosylmethionine ribosyltransferase-isomerase QueA [Caldicellulosiruptor bescii]ACM59395.1 S-adenosylmethionine/tRNA-ribosyltransferase-isomerase [Caldicellulosiruptor bescii DSM 6725]PBC88148.1 S-adenosylmethionine:tRNA ribosyltransferase-isomerase [Caldicellulosiruptor bescii]PBC89757.1 S-adenosylmethionine:tRNA ribosyltransferase-isomerase [Caldicellulosiruptor bescii]PBD04818.1 S-adenosylmethionine:tRNA ribosyltransferase-isomerase [Caldicellulosiruptor bescii]PBD0555